MVKGLDDLAPEGLLDRARRAAALVDDAARVRVFCHYDPDGTTSASILARALMRRGKRIHATMAHALDRTSAARLGEETNELLVVSDMGSGQLDLLEGLPYPVVVLDHHKPIRDSETIAHVNPHLFGVDGAREMCGATTTWLFALVLDERNWDLAGPAMAGAIGDKQAVGGFVGVNAALFGEAVERKVVVPDRRLAIRDQPLGKALAQSVEPYCRGLSGRPEASLEFLRAAGFDSEVMVRQLDAPTRRKLGSVLATRLLEQGAAPEALEALVEDRYWIEPDQMYAQDLEAYVNSCDRLGQEGLGLAVCPRDPIPDRRGTRPRGSLAGGSFRSRRKRGWPQHRVRRDGPERERGKVPAAGRRDRGPPAGARAGKGSVAVEKTAHFAGFEVRPEGR